MHALITFTGFQPVPEMSGRKDKAVGPVRVMGHQTTTSRAPNEGTQMGPLGDLMKTLRVTKGARGFKPSVKTKNGSAKTRHRLEQRFVPGHVFRRLARARSE